MEPSLWEREPMPVRQETPPQVPESGPSNPWTAVGVSVLGAAAVSAAVFQTVTGNSTTLMMPAGGEPGAASYDATAVAPIPGGAGVLAANLGADSIEDLGLTDVSLRSQQSPLAAGPQTLSGAAPAPVRAAASDAPAVAPQAAPSPRAPETRSSSPTRPGGDAPSTTTPRETPPRETTPRETPPRETTPTPPRETTPTPPRETEPETPRETPTVPTPPSSDPTPDPTPEPTPEPTEPGDGPDDDAGPGDGGAPGGDPGANEGDSTNE